jgi:DNA recombination protein RmuC
MEMIYLLIGCMAGGILGAVILYFALKSSMVSRSSYDELNALFIRNKSDLENSNLKIQDLQPKYQQRKRINILQQDFWMI